jgi:hypothetical protein
MPDLYGTWKLFWADHYIGFLHANEHQFRHVFKYLDGTTKSPDSFHGPIGRKLECCVADLPAAKFAAIGNRNFPVHIIK